MALINDISRPCPRCKTAIEKSDGCNKMTCFNCKAYFCYICGDFCDPENPYSQGFELEYENRENDQNFRSGPVETPDKVIIKM